jgi:hypothetical protein
VFFDHVCHVHTSAKPTLISLTIFRRKDGISTNRNRRSLIQCRYIIYQLPRAAAKKFCSRMILLITEARLKDGDSPCFIQDESGN